MWQVEYLREAVDDIKQLDHSQLVQVIKAINKVAVNPLPKAEGGYGKLLGNKGTNNLTGFYKIKLLKLGIRVIYMAEKQYLNKILDKEILLDMFSTDKEKASPMRLTRFFVRNTAIKEMIVNKTDECEFTDSYGLELPEQDNYIEEIILRFDSGYSLHICAWYDYMHLYITDENGKIPHTLLSSVYDMLDKAEKPLEEGNLIDGEVSLRK